MLSKGLGTSNSPIVIESEVEDSPVKVVRGDKFRHISDSLAALCEYTNSDDDGSDLQSDSEDLDHLTESEDEILRNDIGVPIFEKNPDKYSAYKIMWILLDPKLDERKIAYKRPVTVPFSSSFVVDVSKLAHPDDIKKDIYGKWLHSGSHTDVFRCTYSENKDSVDIEKAAPGARGDSVYYLRRLHSVHPSNNEFRRVLALLFDSQKQPHKLCLIVYHMPEGFEPKVQPHGNSKQEKPYYPTLPSTLEAMANDSGGPKEILSKVSASVGGVLGANDPCSLPRNEQQVTDIKRHRKHSQSGLNASCSTDELGIVMQKAYIEDGESCFIREVRMFKEPAVIVAFDRQLRDLEKFCTNEDEFGIMTVDPTFSLGDFDVTISTYRQLLLQCKRSSEHPVFIGPVMIHYKKSFASYLFYASSLVGLCPGLSNLQCFGTDGEEALYGAFKQVFPKAVHLLCSIHFRRNIKAKLHDLNIQEDKQEVVISDIFGKQVAMQHIEGLLDSEDTEEYEKGYEMLLKKWVNMEAENGPLHTFGNWFNQYKSTIVKNSMLKSIRRKARLGNPPSHFTTNASESINAVLKNKVDYKKSELPDFLDKLKGVINEQERELERAIIGRGKYEFCKQFKKMEISEEEWFTRMSYAQKQNHIKRVLSLPPSDKVSKAPKSSAVGKILNTKTSTSVPFDSTKPCCSRQLFQETTAKELSVKVSTFADLVLIPRPVINAIWAKATELLNESNAVCISPGGNLKNRVVKSFSNARPHLVSAKKNGQYACDNDCPNWKSLGICSHSVVAAEDNGDLQAFVEWVKRAKKVPNATKLVITKMPKGRGRKGNVPPRKRKKKEEIVSRKPFTEVISEAEDDLLCAGDLSTSLSTAAKDDEDMLFDDPTEPLYHSSTSYDSSCFQDMYHTHIGEGTTTTVTGGVHVNQSNFWLPQEPPPLVRYSAESVSPIVHPPDTSNPFTLTLVTGNISVCRGCRQRYVKPAVAPFDLCIRHKEWQDFVDPAGHPQQRFGNVYYHCNIPCIFARCPTFSAKDLLIDPKIGTLTETHLKYLHKHMPGRF